MSNTLIKNRAFTIFVVEDNEWFNKMLVHHLSMNPDYHVRSFYNGTEVLKHLHENPDIITIDYRLPDMTGDELLEKIRERNDKIDLIAISEQEDIDTAVGMIKKGAFDYIVKSSNIKDRLYTTVQHIFKKSMLEKRIELLENEVQSKYEFEKTILGNSKAIKALFPLISKAVNSNITVSISGETGTGKEIVAKAIHFNSENSKKPFVAINMAAIPKELFESELFGYEKGAFTGAITSRKGKFEEADGGTLFLDEIAEVDINFQAKLLRAIQEKEIVRVGSNTPVSINCRIIVATHKNLQEEVKKGNFREDLYYRLFGLPIHLPKLSEREKDILVLAKAFIERFAKENMMEMKQLTSESQMKLLNYPWPGNIRELKSVIELSMVLSNSEMIQVNDIVLSDRDPISEIVDDEKTLKEYDLKILKLFLDRYNQNTKIVAKKLDIGQTTVYRMMKDLKNP